MDAWAKVCKSEGLSLTLKKRCLALQFNISLKLSCLQILGANSLPLWHSLRFYADLWNMYNLTCERDTILFNSGFLGRQKTFRMQTFPIFDCYGQCNILEVWRTDILPFSLPFLLLIITMTFQSLTLLSLSASPWKCPVSCLINDHSLQMVQLSTHTVHYP